MSCIVTITFSPCIDKSTSVLSMSPDIKMSCTSVKEEPGGGGINVARALNKLEFVATALYIAGGCVGKKLDQFMQDEGIPTIVIPSISETRENIIIVDESDNKQYRFGMPMTSVTQSENEQVVSQLNALDELTFIVVSGSIPPGVPLSIFTEISEIAERRNAKLIVDTKGDALRSALDAGVYLIKPNLGELSVLVGKKELLKHEIKDEARTLIKKGKCSVVIISMGAEGAMLVTSTISKQIKPPSVERKSTVGAGDSMVAGIVYALSQGKSLEDAIQYGVACGTAATLNPGTELCRKVDVEKLLPQITVKEVE